MNATTAIARSVSHGETVNLTVDVNNENDERRLELFEACEDTITTKDDVEEYWGTNDEGKEWRVHVKLVNSSGGPV